MDAWSDIDGAIQAAIKQRSKRVENLVAASSVLILLGATWLVWPTLSAAVKGQGGLLNGLGMPIIILVWGLLVQDIGLTNPSARTRVGASATIAWPVLLMIASKEVVSFTEIAVIGPLLVAIAAGSCFVYSNTVLRGGLDVQRFRSLMTGVGFVAAFSIFVGDIPEPSSTTWFASVTTLGVTATVVAYIWVSGDELKGLRREFKTRLDHIETRILILKTQQAAVDQASSLIMTARAEGHVDPELGMKLLDDAEEDIKRSISLAGDVQIVKEDARCSVEQAKEIAPNARKPRKSFDMALREVELGSLREGELLFRQAKMRAIEIIEWWGKAEAAITEASKLLSGKSGDNVNHLHAMLADAKKKLAAESPKKAFEYAFTIPAQLSAGDDALGRAAMAIKEAERQLAQADGVDITELKVRLHNALAALDAGNASQAVGLADGVVRSIKAERVAMDETRRALRQKKKLIKQFESRQDSAQWQARLDEIIKSAEEKQWTYAATKLNQMTAELDKSGKEETEARELLDFVTEEWKILRNQLEAAMIKPDDKERLQCEASVAKADEELSGGRVESCLERLSVVDNLMEKLRRRI